MLQRIPLLIRAIFAGLLVSTIGVATWSVLVAVWFLHPAAFLGIPWPVPVMACGLFLFCWYLGGRGWPRSTAAARRRSFRAFNLPAHVWRQSLLAGGLATVSLAGVVVLFPRLTGISWTPVADVSGLRASALPLLVMAALVAGICEEAGFRGFLQAPLERRYGPVLAILVSGVVFGLIHAGHADWRFATLPLYVLFSAVLGTLAWRTGSTVPGMILHTSLDVFLFLRSWLMGPPVAHPTVWEAGAAPGDGLLGLATLAFAGAALWAFRRQGRTGVAPVDSRDSAGIIPSGRPAAPSARGGCARARGLPRRA